jgi:small subunit ribosomal protein S16
MATKIRLTRLGKKKQPTYRVVVMDSRRQRDGKYIEQLGFYDPRPDPSIVTIDNERALHWLNTGAQPTERAQKLLEISGAWTQFKIAKGEIHTIAEVAPADAAPAEVVPEIHVVEDSETVEDSQEVVDVQEDIQTVEAEESEQEAAIPQATTDDSSEKE